VLRAQAEMFNEMQGFARTMLPTYDVAKWKGGKKVKRPPVPVAAFSWSSLALALA
jgi:hypothetical protein